MKQLTPLVLLLVAACADPESFRSRCASIYGDGFPQLVARCMEREAALERGRQVAPALGIVAWSGANAMREHNFYVYDVPRAQRYLGR